MAFARIPQRQTQDRPRVGNHLVDRQGVERRRDGQRVQPPGPSRAVVCGKDSEAQLADGPGGDGDAPRRVGGTRSILFDGDEERGVGERELAIVVLTGREHASGRSSVVPGRRSASSGASSGSPCQRSLSPNNVFQAIDLSLVGNGSNAASGSHAANSTALTSLRN